MGTGGVIRASVKAPPLLVKLQIDGISFEELAANPTKQGVFEDALVRAVALQLKTEEENVKLKLPVDSGPVEVTVDMATPKDPEVVKTAVAIAVETEAKDVNGIDDFKIGGGIRVSVKAPPLLAKLQIDGIN